MNLWKQFKESLKLRADVGGGVQYRPDSDLFYQNYGFQTATGLRVSPESAMRLSAVYACVRVIAETIASLPLIIYRDLPNGGKERATDHPLFWLLHDKPNQWQTSYEFMEMMQAHLELRGNAFARIVAGNSTGPTRSIDQLIPLHPDRVSVFRMPNGKLQYQVRYFYTAQVETYPQEEIWHLRGLSSDGLVGMSTVGVGAEAIGVGLAAQEFAGRFFENDSTPSGVMTHPKTLSDAAHDRIKKSWREAHSGINQHSVALLEENMTYTNIGISNKDSQFLESREFSRADIAAIFRVPPHKIGDLSRATFSNIEQQNIEFATDAIRPRLVRLERRLNNDIVSSIDLGDETHYFAEFMMDALLRGDLKSRYDAYSVGINAGFLTRAGARAAENLNPIPGLEKPLMPLNLSVVDENGNAIPVLAPEDATGTSARRLGQFVEAAAERVVRKEVSALRRGIGRAGSVEEFKASAREFYSTHGEYLRNVMHIGEFACGFYCTRIIGIFEGCMSSADIETAVAEHESKGPGMLVEIAEREFHLLTPRKVRTKEEFAPVGAMEE